VKAHVIVSVADESVLRLVGYQLPDLVEKFYYPRANSVETSSSMRSLKAGDGGPSASKKRRNFKDTADFQAHIATDEKGDAEFSFKLPDDLTTWVVEALAASDAMTVTAFEKEFKSLKDTPPGQKALDTNLTMSDHHFVGGARTKIMSTKPVLLRTALPRFMVWGDTVQGRAIVTNRTDKPVKGTLSLGLIGDARLAGDAAKDGIPFSVAPKSETVLPVTLNIGYNTGHLAVSGEIKDAAGAMWDGLETNYLVYDRSLPEVMATSGVTRGTVTEKILVPPTVIPDRGGLAVSLRASLAMAITPYLRGLIEYPYGCAEQKSSALIALLYARQLAGVHGEPFFDRVASSWVKSKLNDVPTWDIKKKILDARIEDTIQDLIDNYQNGDGGIQYWEGASDSSVYTSGQVYWAWSLARSLHYKVPDGAVNRLATYLLNEVSRKPDDLERLPAAERAYLLWALSLDGKWAAGQEDELLKDLPGLSVRPLAFLIMGLMNHGDKTQAKGVADRLRTLAKQTPRKTLWPMDWSLGYGGGEDQNTALAANALFTLDHKDPLVPRAMASILTSRKSRAYVMTQENIAIAWLIYNYSNTFKEDETDFKATVTMADTPVVTAEFSKDNLISTVTQDVPMTGLVATPMPATVKLSKEGDGSLYYDMVFKYYLPLDQVSPASEGIVVTREYYDLSDSKEAHPLTSFVAGQNYKGHVTVIVPLTMETLVVEDLLPSGFEAIDMTLATSSKAAGEESEADDSGREGPWWSQYADRVAQPSFGTNYAFDHQEIRDDRILWSGSYVSPGAYHIRYPVRATTAGTYNGGTATAFAFYDPEIFGRSRAHTLTILDPAKTGKAARE
jgi:uncharacterized protein YfaS (alpha-2-macroglobulin family)